MHSSARAEHQEYLLNHENTAHFQHMPKNMALDVRVRWSLTREHLCSKHSHAAKSLAGTVPSFARAWNTIAPLPSAVISGANAAHSAASKAGPQSSLGREAAPPVAGAMVASIASVSCDTQRSTCRGMGSERSRRVYGASDHAVCMVQVVQQHAHEHWVSRRT